MPLMAKYQYDYEEDYLEEYECYYDSVYDYGYNDSDGITDGLTSDDFNGNVIKLDQCNVPPVYWHCTVCKYDNPESLSVCDICGAIYNASLAVSQTAVTKDTVNETCKASQKSVLAKSLFAGMPSQKPKQAKILQQIRDDLQSSKADGYQGILCANFHDIQKFFVIPDSKSRNISIEPFKFDSPSPDDVVLEGKHATGKAAAATSNSSSATPTSSLRNNVEAEVEAQETRSVVQKQKALTSTALPIVNRTDKNQKEASCRFLGQQEALSERTSEGTAGDHEQRNPSNLKVVLPLEEYKPESWMLLEEKEPDKSLLHLAIVGHVDAGKSTMMGRLLHLMGQVSEKEMRKYEREAKQKGKGSFAYAWVLDESAEERERGLTMTVAVAHFELRNFKVVLLDSPGHKDFVPNMLSGASQADAAVLVIDASIGAFEAGMYGQGEGQTKEHAQLIRSFGVEQLIIAVNKMDTLDNCEGRFCFIKSQLGPFLRRCGFKESSMIWIPLSALDNQNLTSATSDTRLNSWYSGPYLLEAIDHLQPPKRDISRPLRLPISEVSKSRSLGQVAISGKLEGGALKIGTKVLVMPAGVVATVKAIKQDTQVCAVARAGDSVDIALQGIDISSLMIGGVLCHPDYPVPIAIRIELRVVILDITMPILVGSQVELYIHHVREAAKVVQLLSILDPKTGLVRKKAPRCLTANQNAFMEVVPDRGACIEEYNNYRALGRVTLRAAGRTIAVGIVNRIIEQQ